MRESSGNWSDSDTICSTRGFVTLTDETFSHLASRDGFPKPRPPKRTGSARIFLSSWLHRRNEAWDIAFSNVSNRSCGWDRENSANLAMSLIQLDTLLLTHSSKCSLDPVAAPRCFCPCTVTLMDVSLNASPTLSSLAGFAMIQHFLSFGKYPKSGPRVLRASHHVLISVIKL